MAVALESAGLPYWPSYLDDAEERSTEAATFIGEMPFGGTLAKRPSEHSSLDPNLLQWDERTQTHIWPEGTKKGSSALHLTSPGGFLEEECVSD